MHKSVIKKDLSQNIVIGTGGHGKVVFSVLRDLGVKKKKIYFIDGFKKRFDLFVECPVLGGLMDTIDFSVLNDKEVQLFMGYGGNAYQGNFEREQMYETAIQWFKDRGYTVYIPPLIHPSVVTLRPYPTLSQGICVCARASIGPDVTIRKGVIVNTGVIVEHDVDLGDFAQIASGVTILGGAKIGKRVFIGGNATIAPGIEIGENSIIGMGSVVTKDVEPNSIVYGVPARVVRTRESPSD